MSTQQAPASGSAPADTPAEYDGWRRGRWEEVAGPNGKARVVANGMVTGPDVRTLPGVPGRWATDGTGALTVTASAADGVVVDGVVVDGTSQVPPGDSLEFPGGLVGFVGGSDGAYGLVVRDHAAVERSGLTGIDAYPYDPAWVLEGEYRAAPEGRRIEVERLTSPCSTEAILAPVDLVVTVNGTEHVMAVLEDMPGQRLVVFTDRTNGRGTPGIGRWLVLPLLEPGSTLTVDFNKATLSHHHLRPSVFVCPLSPPGNHLPLRVEAGERALIHDTTGQGPAAPLVGTPHTEGSDTMSRDPKDKAVTYLRSLERGDWETARAMCASTATVWHNDGKGEQTIADNIVAMAGQADTIESMRYDITRQFTRPGEVLQQHVVHVAAAGGVRGQVFAAVYFRFDDDGLITRIEEYADFVPEREAAGAA
ncbi:DUF1684 domain-containing protein [Nocardiopsis alborubida]|uniref:DUF1684 domain-containing protein n=1 Tax=Nocardiopsis alborubida TaxID=146802 RepID=A0A7X6RTD7_9ACTN|nr:DUF1684 domain-containing protein [Nocardiopsis alborubida]NKZ01981.1 DUF1684 domain-containing protein [Nocardiopsis alborubida]